MNWNEDYWFHPTYAIEYFWDLNKKTNGSAKKSPLYKKEREAWIMGVALLAISKEKNRDWWLQIPKDDPPDMSCMTMVKNHGHFELNQQDVEIITITKYSKGSISQIIESKLKLKAYPERYVLLIYLSRFEFFKFEIVAEEIKRVLKDRLSSVWLIGNTEKHNIKKYIVCQIYPKIIQHWIDLDYEIKNSPEIKFMYTSKVLKKDTTLRKVKATSIPKFIP